MKLKQGDVFVQRDDPRLRIYLGHKGMCATHPFMKSVAAHLTEAEHLCAMFHVRKRGLTVTLDKTDVSVWACFPDKAVKVLFNIADMFDEYMKEMDSE